MNKVEIKSRVSLFVILWCIASIFHSVSFLTLFNGISNLDLIRLIILTLSLGQLFFNKGYFLFIVALFFSISIVVILPGSVPNHIFFEGLVNITILIYILYYLFRLYYSKLLIEDIEIRIYTVIAPFIRISIIVLYFFVVLHKLNYDFFNPYISCSGNFFSRILEDFDLTKIGFVEKFHNTNFILLRNFSIYFAIISEAAIPLLLLFKKTRNIGIAYGIFFHFVLALHFHGGIYSFSAMMLVYFSLFFEQQSVNRFSSYFEKAFFRYIVFGCVLLIAILYFSIPSDSNTLFIRDSTKLLSVGLIFFLVYSIFYFIIFWSTKERNYIPNKLKFNLKPITLVVILFLFFNGFSPYLGFRTEVCFSMFSNLQTEANLNNHFFIGPKIRLFSYQDELIQIKSTNIESLKSFQNDKEIRILPFELNRVLKLSEKDNQDFYVEFIHKNTDMKTYKEKGEIFGDNVEVYSNFLLLKYLSFRPVFVENKCQH